ncbi:hypothetical protein GCM10027296_23330 [Chitinimonas naiadis]
MCLYVGTYAEDLSPKAAKQADCHVGIYRLRDQRVVDIGLSGGGKLRWRQEDGTSGALTEGTGGNWNSTLGWTGRPDGKVIWLSECAKGEIRFDGIVGKRIAFDVTETTFESQGTRLAGRLVMPKGHGKVPVVVLVHGAEFDAARDVYALQRMFPAAGIGAFVYDKRGTGASGGTYSQNFDLLASDVVKATEVARRLAGKRAGRVGYQAGSQGGWVAPIAATRTPVDFVIVGFGLAVSVLDEDRQAAELNMTMNGFGPAEVAKAHELTDATAVIVASGFKEGLAEFDTLRERYRDEPWFKYLKGNFSFLLLGMPTADIPIKGQAYNWGTPWHYDPMPTLRSVTAPQLWILGGEDIDAPYAETLRRLKTLAAEGKPISTALYPTAEHGIYEFETGKDGERLSTRNSAGYFRLMRDYILKGRLSDKYGAAELTVPR